MKKIILMFLIVTPMAFGLFAMQAKANGDNAVVSLYCKPDRSGKVLVVDVVSNFNVADDASIGDSCAESLVALTIEVYSLVSTTHTSYNRVVYTLVGNLR